MLYTIRTVGLKSGWNNIKPLLVTIKAYPLTPNWNVEDISVVKYIFQTETYTVMGNNSFDISNWNIGSGDTKQVCDPCLEERKLDEYFGICDGSYVTRAVLYK